MNCKKLITIAGFSMLATFCEAGNTPVMPDGKAVFQQQKQQEYTGKLVFDPVNLTYEYGTKRVIIKRDGTFSVVSNGKQMANFYFFVQTPYKYWLTNLGGMPVTPFDGTRIRVMKITTQGNEIVLDGLIPCNKPKDALRAIPWKFKIKPLDGGRISFDLRYDWPEDLKGFRSDSGTFLNLSNVKDLECGDQIWFTNKNSPSRWKQETIKINGMLPQNSYKLEVSTEHRLSKNSLRIGFDKNHHVQFTLDLGKSFKKSAVKPESGVDFLKDHALRLPEHGKNMLLNPYFAQGLHYLSYLGNNARGPHHYELVTDNPKFGKYCLGFRDAKEVGYVVLYPVPANAGKYVFSFYARGKGNVNIWNAGAKADWGTRNKKTVRGIWVASKDWKRYELPLEQKNDGILSLRLIVSTNVCMDGLQLEKGSKATSFEAPAVSARMTALRPDSVFNRGEDVKLTFELSTLEPAVKGTAAYRITNFYGETVKEGKESFNFKTKEYPVFPLNLGKKVPDGIYVVAMTYQLANGKKNSEYFRFSVMPFKNNTHKTAKMFTHTYLGGAFVSTERLSNLEYILKQTSRIGYGCWGHQRFQTPEQLALFKKYNVIPFDAYHTTRTNAKTIKSMFPDLNPKPGHVYTYVIDPKGGIYDNKKGLWADYRLTGWNAENRKKFKKIISEQTRNKPCKCFSYEIGSEWPNDVKDDPHYPDMVIAYAEAIREVYPDAKVYEGGATNMDVGGGCRQVENFLKRVRGKWKPSFVANHTYTKDMRQLYYNFKRHVQVADENGCKDVPIALPEGGHYWNYAVPEWGCNQIGWMGDAFRAGTLTYDLGWTERVSAAYYARGYLVFLTEFDRVWSATLATSLDIDVAGTPDAAQKSVNTLVDLLGSPKRFLGNCTFAPDTMCLVWEDENGRPVAAVWNEEASVNAGMKDAPMAELKYKDAEFIDLMGSPRKLTAKGQFPVSPFPLFIRGKKGDCDNFVKAVSTAVLHDPDKLPCRLSFELINAKQARLTIENPLARKIQGTITISGKKHVLSLAKNSSQSILLDLPQALRPNQLEKITVPYSCELQGRVIRNEFSINCFSIPKFKGDWSRIPTVTLTNRTGNTNFTDKDFHVKCQYAWDAKKLYLRITVKDDIFAPGTINGFRWNYDAAQIYFDTRCSALKKGGIAYDDDDYAYCLQPTADGKRCEVWRQLSPDIQLTLGVGAPKNDTLAPEIPAKFTKTADGYIYEAEFPADYLLPMRLVSGYNFGFGILVADKDKGANTSHGFTNTSEPGKGCHNRPHLWPIAVLTE